MERKYFRGGQGKTVEEIDHVVTIRETPNEGEASKRSSLIGMFDMSRDTSAGVRSFGTAVRVAEV